MLFEGANIARKIALTILEPQRARSHCCPCPCRRAPASIEVEAKKKALDL